MPKFTYAAIDPAGSNVEGVTKADTIGEARALLMEQNLFPIKLAEKRSALSFEVTTEKLKKKELMHFTRQLAVFIRAGIPVTTALETIGDEAQDRVLRKVILEMTEQLRNGGTFSNAADQHPEAFPAYYRGILGSAELTGNLDTTLDDLAEYLERELDTRSKIISALTYPVIVMGLAFVTVAVLAGYVLPQFKPLFEELDADLPLPTRMLLFVADLFTTMWYIPFSFFVLTASFVGWMLFTDKGKLFRDRLVLKIPILSGIIDYAILERFCRILAAMIKAGVPLPDAMKVTTDATTNSVYRDRFADARTQMLEGAGFTKPLVATELFPGAARQMFKVGEETGTLDMQLAVAADYFDRELESRIKKFTALFEPLMIVFVGVIVGFVAMALVSAMYGVLGNMKEEV